MSEKTRGGRQVQGNHPGRPRPPSGIVQTGNHAPVKNGKRTSKKPCCPDEPGREPGACSFKFVKGEESRTIAPPGREYPVSDLCAVMHVSRAGCCFQRPGLAFFIIIISSCGYISYLKIFFTEFRIISLGCKKICETSCTCSLISSMRIFVARRLISLMGCATQVMAGLR